MSSDFEHYLRTGRRSLSATPIETKFNPWHDAEDGRFTFASQGRYFPSRGVARQRTGAGTFTGDGGSFGGGGASGSWGREGGNRGSGGASGLRPASQRSGGSPDPIIVVSAPYARPKAAAVRQQSRLTFYRNGFDFVIDAHARTRRVSGELKLQSQRRSKKVQLDAGKPDRRSTDHGGHYIATRFNGPREWFNHFAQDSNFNQSGYFKLENEWARAVHSGQRVFVDIVPYYRGSSMRPYKLRVVWKVGGRRQSKDFQNEKGGQ